MIYKRKKYIKSIKPPKYKIKCNKKYKIKLKEKKKIRPKKKIKNKINKKISNKINDKIIPIITPPVQKKLVQAKKPVSKVYFTQSTEDAIIRYNNETNLEIRNKIYREHIEYPLQKLVENVFNRFGFTYFETGPLEVQKEALAHLVANLGKYDPNRVSKTFGKFKKSKAFSYFSVIAKNWFILLNNNNYKRFQSHVEISEEHSENTIQLQHVDKHYAEQETSEFISLTIEFWEENVSKIFPKKRDLNIANAVVELIRNSHRIDAFNKKALYLYIRDISDCKTQQITKVINRMKQYHKNIYRMYLNDGIFSKNLQNNNF